MAKSFELTVKDTAKNFKNKSIDKADFIFICKGVDDKEFFGDSKWKQKSGQQKQSPRNEKKMMSAELVADKIVNAVQKRKNSLVLTFQGKLVVFLNKFFPNLVSRLVFNSLSKEKKSPF